MFGKNADRGRDSPTISQYSFKQVWYLWNYIIYADIFACKLWELHRKLLGYNIGQYIEHSTPTNPINQPIQGQNRSSLVTARNPRIQTDSRKATLQESNIGIVYCVLYNKNHLGFSPTNQPTILRTRSTVNSNSYFHYLFNYTMLQLSDFIPLFIYHTCISMVQAAPDSGWYPLTYSVNLSYTIPV